jgi:hypothetical protein
MRLPLPVVRRSSSAVLVSRPRPGVRTRPPARCRSTPYTKIADVHDMARNAHAHGRGARARARRNEDAGRGNGAAEGSRVKEVELDERATRRWWSKDALTEPQREYVVLRRELVHQGLAP